MVLKSKNKVQILSYDLMSNLKSFEKISKILNIVMAGDIVMLEGRISYADETELISSALKNVSGKFSGIEVAYLDKNNYSSILDKFKNSIIKLLAKDRIGITVIGPSKLIKEIKMDPNKLEILFK